MSGIPIVALDAPAAARQIGGACETIGFFAITGHGVAPGIIDAMQAASRAFFALPQAEKGAAVDMSD